MSEAEAPYEVVNLVPRMTGLPMSVWASPRGHARHRAQREPAPGLDPGVRIKVNPTHGPQMAIRDAVTVAVRPAPRVIPTDQARGLKAHGTLSPADRQAVFQWIAMNEAALVDYWDFRIYTDEFLQRLQPISPPIPP